MVTFCLKYPLSHEYKNSEIVSTPLLKMPPSHRKPMCAVTLPTPKVCCLQPRYPWKPL